MDAAEGDVGIARAHGSDPIVAFPWRSSVSDNSARPSSFHPQPSVTVIRTIAVGSGSVREVVFSPEGAAVNSQGREPLDAEQPPTQSPNGATVAIPGEALPPHVSGL